MKLMKSGIDILSLLRYLEENNYIYFMHRGYIEVVCETDSIFIC